MADPYLRERIENWVSDFVQGEGARPFESVVREYAPSVLVPLLLAPCEERGIGPDEVTEADLRAAFCGAVARVELPGSVRAAVPDLCAAFLEDLERGGRLGGGRAAGLVLRAARRTYLEAAGAPRQPVRRAAPKLSPNDPCPCGSGRKYKKCCA